MKDLDSIRAKLEKHFKDAVDIDFVIQEGKLWIINARIAKRTGMANLKITIDLFREKIIDENEVISKIRLTDINEVLQPILQNENDLKIISKGLPASPGIATGKLFFSSEYIIRDQEYNKIFCKNEVSPEDLTAMSKVRAIITARGGMTSHAAVVSRGLGICCITGIGDLKIDPLHKEVNIGNNILKEGDWITVNGNMGYVYIGKGKFINPDWRNNKELYLLHRIIEKVICTNFANVNIIGKMWLIRDFFFHNIPFGVSATKKKNIKKQNYVSFEQPAPRTIKEYNELLIDITPDYEDIKLIIIGLRNTLLRQLANKVGIGNHYKYYRPLLDPMLCIDDTSNEHIKEQFIGEEFFNIGRYLPNYIDIYSVRIYFKIQTDNCNLSFLDYTNTKGESLILNSGNICKFHIEINDLVIDIKELANLYSIFRKREYFWTWYIDNHTTHKEMIDFLEKPQKERIEHFRLNEYAHELELLENNSLTKSGKSLI